jgi:hypothetical protein
VTQFNVQNIGAVIFGISFSVELLYTIIKLSQFGFLYWNYSSVRKMLSLILNFVWEPCTVTVDIWLGGGGVRSEYGCPVTVHLSCPIFAFSALCCLLRSTFDR